MRTAVALLLVAALAGCSGGAPESDEASSEPDDASPQPTQETPAPAPLPEPGPLEVYLGYGSEVSTAEEWVVQIAWREDRVSACMSEQGFEYTPQVPAVDEIQYAGGPVPGSREFVEEYGYGAWVTPPGGTGGGFTYTRASDPNNDLREAMSEAEGEAYDTALWGPVFMEGEDGSVGREGGCRDRADDPASGADAYLTGVRDEGVAYLEAMADSSAFDEVNAAWASCMADGGFTYSSPADAQQQFRDEVAADTADGIGSDRDVAAEHSIEEVRVAVADLDCQEATDWAARHRAIEIQLQQEYVDAHLADLEALAAALVTAPTTD